MGKGGAKAGARTGSGRPVWMTKKGAGGSKGADEWGGGLALEDTNMANVGTNEDRDRRRAVAMGEPCWKEAGPPPRPGTLIWRVENQKGGKFGVKPWPKERYGELYLGDSYIMLHTTPGEECDVDEERYAETFFWKNASFKKGENKLDIYYWLGKDSSIDEIGTAAIKTIELDSYLSGRCTHHREVSGYECSAFLNLMHEVAAGSPVGEITYLQGGTASGFTRAAVQTYGPGGEPLGFQPQIDVTRAYTSSATLIRTKSRSTRTDLKGQEYVEVMHGKIDPAVLLTDAVYIIDCGFHIFTWIGADANQDEQDSALVYCERYVRTREGAINCPTTTIRQGYETELFTEVFGNLRQYNEGCDATISFVVRGDWDRYPCGPARDRFEELLQKACGWAANRGRVSGEVPFDVRAIRGPFQQDPHGGGSTKLHTIQCQIDTSAEAAHAIVENITKKQIAYSCPGFKCVDPALIEVDMDVPDAMTIETIQVVMRPAQAFMPPGMQADLMKVKEAF